MHKNFMQRFITIPLIQVSGINVMGEKLSCGAEDWEMSSYQKFLHGTFWVYFRPYFESKYNIFLILL
jgi:hypothetical protein